MQVEKCAARGCMLEIQDAKMMQKIAICEPSHNFVGLYLRNQRMYDVSTTGKKLVIQQYFLYMSPQYG